MTRPKGKDTPKPPKGLSRKARAFWQGVVEAFELEGHHLELLEQAARCLDRIAAAEKAIAEAGMLVADRFGQLKEHPAVEVELKNKRAFKSLLRELQLDIEPADAGYSRPPALPSHGLKVRGA